MKRNDHNRNSTLNIQAKYVCALIGCWYYTACLKDNSDDFHAFYILYSYNVKFACTNVVRSYGISSQSALILVIHVYADSLL